MSILFTWLPTLSYLVALSSTLIAAIALKDHEAWPIALAYLVAQLLTLATTRASLHGLQVALFGIDLLLLLVLIWMVSRATQRWPLLLVALQTLTVLGHAARLQSPKMWPLAYAILLNWTAWPAFATIVVGLWWDWRRADIT